MDSVAVEPKQPLLLIEAFNEHYDAIRAYVPVTSQLLAEMRRLQTLCQRFDLVEATTELDVYEHGSYTALTDVVEHDLLVSTQPLSELVVEDGLHGIDASYLTVDRRGWLTIELDDGSGNDSGSTFVADGRDLRWLCDELREQGCGHVL